MEINPEAWGNIRKCYSELFYNPFIRIIIPLCIFVRTRSASKGYMQSLLGLELFVHHEGYFEFSPVTLQYSCRHDSTLQVCKVVFETKFASFI